MAIGLVSDQEFEEELNREKTTLHHSNVSHIEVIPTRGRKSGDNNVPDSLRKIIGETSVIEGSQAAMEIAEKFGISRSSVSAYAKGATSTASYDSPKPSIIQHINKARHKAIKRAGIKMNQALDSISQDKLDMTDAKDLAGIARDMSAIIKNLEPPAAPQQEENKNVQFVVYAPQFTKEEHYDVIQSNE